MSEKLPLVLLPGLASDATVWEHPLSKLQDVSTMQVITSHEKSAK